MSNLGKEEPLQWIGIEADWMLRSRNPWRHLVSVTPSDLRTHALVLGATGSGKTVLLHHLIAQDLERGSSVCVLDLRGDLVSAVIELCARHVPAHLVRVIDLREKTRPFGFNPLYGAGEPYFRALAVLDVVARESESWGIQLSESLRCALMLLAEVGAPVTALDRLFSDRAYRLSLLRQVETGSVVDFWNRFDALSEERQLSLAMPVLNKVSLLLSTPTIRRILGHPQPFDLGRHLDTPGSVTLVSLAVDELHASGRMMGSLVLSAICREIFARVATPEDRRNPVRLIVDELQNFGDQDFEGVLAEGRRFKFSCVLAFQSLAQVSPRMRAMILGNVGVKFVFRCGRDDAATMNKDIYGEPKSYDFSELPVGYSLLWRRDKGVVEVEVNQPLLGNVGQRSELGRRYLDQVYASAGYASASPAFIASPESQRSNWIERSEEMEDWLCG